MTNLEKLKRCDEALDAINASIDRLADSARGRLTPAAMEDRIRRVTILGRNKGWWMRHRNRLAEALNEKSTTVLYHAVAPLFLAHEAASGGN